MNHSKTWSILFLILFVVTLVLICSVNIVIDPFFHYHPPLEGLGYPIENERYQNNGILKHFTYDAIITGTSMTENFKASECDELFGVTSVKTCFSGSSFREINEQLQRAVAANPDIRLIIRGLDGWNLLDDKDHMRTDAEYPTYLYDDFFPNDVQYLLNKQILCENTMKVLRYSLLDQPTTSFDEYGNWASQVTFSRQTVLSGYDRPPASSVRATLTQEDICTVTQTLQQNVVALALENPDIQFYYFFTPYSIVYMDMDNQYGILERQFDAYVLASELLLEVENIHLFSFFDDYDTVTNLDNYYDPAHYSEEINSMILQAMARGEHQLTQENYQAYWQQVRDFYTGYDYEALFTQ